MSRAIRERERQKTRRTTYPSTRQPAVPKRDRSYKRVLGDATPAEQPAEIRYRARHSGRDTAVHEAGHAVAAWLQGERIAHVMFNDRGSAHHDAQLDQCVAMTVTGEALTDDEVKNNKSALQGTAEGFVPGCNAAFSGLSEEAVIVEHARILGVVSKTFERERIQNITLLLAAVLYGKR